MRTPTLIIGCPRLTVPGVFLQGSPEPLHSALTDGLLSSLVGNGAGGQAQLLRVLDVWPVSLLAGVWQLPPSARHGQQKDFSAPEGLYL